MKSYKNSQACEFSSSKSPVLPPRAPSTTIISSTKTIIKTHDNVQQLLEWMGGFMSNVCFSQMMIDLEKRESPYVWRTLVQVSESRRLCYIDRLCGRRLQIHSKQMW